MSASEVRGGLVRPAGMVGGRRGRQRPGPAVGGGGGEGREEEDE